MDDQMGLPWGTNHNAHRDWDPNQCMENAANYFEALAFPPAEQKQVEHLFMHMDLRVYAF